MNGNAGELLATMRVRLEMQQKGITNPPDGVKAATRALVERLSRIDPSEAIEVTTVGPLLAQYKRVATGEVLAEIHDEKVEYQLVLQFPCNSMEEFDAVVKLEDILIAELSGSPAEVDGHDSGSGEANIFIFTSHPRETFERAHAVVSRASYLPSVLRAAYRRLDEEVYTVLWPLGETRFVVI
jgi:hypothetical protein